MWPYINQEDLAKSKTLPLLLNSRARHHPSAFAAADCEAMHLGNITMAIVPIFLNNHIMTLNGMTQKVDYGRIVSWDDDERAFDWMMSRKQFLPGEGLLILEAQSRLLEFLIGCCHKILHDIPSEEVVSSAYPINPEPSLPASSDINGNTSLVDLAEAAPYRLPAKLDLEKIASLLAARTSSAEDHIWALREDPGYYASHLLDMKEHRQEMLKDTMENDHPSFSGFSKGILWARVIGSVLVEAHIQLELFSELHQQARRLKLLQQKHEANIAPLKDLPEEYLEALLKFRHYLTQTAKGPMEQLKIAVPASPPMRRFFVRDIPVSDSSSKIGVRTKPGVNMDKPTGQLLWLLKTLWEDGQDLFSCRLPDVMDELDRMLKADQDARELVSPYVAKLISELSIVAECLRQLEIYQPWANGFESALVERQKGIQSEFSERTKNEARIVQALHESHIIKIYTFGDPSDKRFDYPVDKKRNKANVETMQSAEANLDTFWAKIDNLLYNLAGNLDGTAIKRLLSQTRSLQRTSDWIEPAAGKNKREREKSPPDVDALTKPLSQLFHGPEPSSVRKDALATDTAKPKIKSRASASLAQTDSTDVAAQRLDISLDIQPTFAVDSRALKVFRILFFNPTANTTPGELQWTEFLYAMVCVGFRAQKLYGSVWHFQPTRLDVERSIQFHEPHPRPRIPFLVARRHGRRLNRAYGWHGSMFVSKDK